AGDRCRGSPGPRPREGSHAFGERHHAWLHRQNRTVSRSDSMTLRTVRDLLTNDDLAALRDSPPIATGRHPTWYPVFYSSPRPVDHLSNQAVRLIANAGGNDWLGRLAPRLSRIDDPEEAAAALAELRTY